MRTPAPLWIFDLDNTLHDASHGIFPHINREMTAYIMRHLDVDAAQAQQIREVYWHRYGATLTGLVKHHGVQPAHFLRETHPIESLLDRLRFDPSVAGWLKQLRGQKVVFSNGPTHYARAVVGKMKLHPHLSAVFGIDHFACVPKPRSQPYRQLLGRLGVAGRRCIMVEDSVHNLLPAKRLGMTTVWLAPQRVTTSGFVDYHIRHLSELVRLPCAR